MAGRKDSETGKGIGGNEGTSKLIDPTTAIADGDSGNGGGGSDGSDYRDATGERFDPNLHVHPDKRNRDGSFRRRKQSGGSRNKGKGKAANNSDLESVAHILAAGMVMFHGALANATKTPELVLSEEEATNLSKTGLDFLSHFDVAPDPKVISGVVFASQIMAVYGSRYAAIRIRKAQEKKEKDAGVAGVYSPDGVPMGTTEYNSTYAEQTPGMGGLTN
jgi:hypothetical protein